MFTYYLTASYGWGKGRSLPKRGTVAKMDKNATEKGNK